MKPFTLIEQPAALHNMLADLQRSRQVAIDTESNSFYAYYERICLLQISTLDRDYIIDTLALRDISALGEVLANPGVEKIFHAASNDVLGLKRDFQFQIYNLFDTAIACKLLGCRQLGLAKILEEHFGVQLNKKWQRCDWGKRPLKEEQLAYARLDTHYLISLRNRLGAELNDQELWDQASEAFAKACEQEAQEKTFQAENFIQIRGAHTLDATGKHILRALYVYREQEARRRDRAPFRIISNDALFRLAQARPSTTQEFSKIKGLPQNYRKGRGVHNLLKLIRKAQNFEKDAKAQS